MKRTLSLLLALCLLVTPALADEALSMLPAVNDYALAGYTDVEAGSWYADAARVCYETGLMTGTQVGFEPGLTLSGGQLIAIAARLREAIVGDAMPEQESGEVWYGPALRYLKESGAETPEPEEPASRLQFAQLLAAVTPASYLPAINAVPALPDCDDAAVLALYNAGVLTGGDEYGTFNPAGTLTRAECATMTARVVQPQLRKTFTLQEKPAAPLSYEEELMATEAVRVNGQTVTFATLTQTLNDLIFRTDIQRIADGGAWLDWDAQYQGIDDLGSYFLNLALQSVVENQVLAARASSLGCTVETLPQTLIPDPSAYLDRIYRAKHILVSDEATAANVLAQLMKAPSLELFDQLLAKYGTDPGMASYPDGYLFTDGDMVSEFENAVKALNVGSCTSVPVQSQFGWHIVLRLDPREYPDWENEVREMLYDSTVDAWVQNSTVTYNTVELNKLDVRGRYEQYLTDMGF